MLVGFTSNDFRFLSVSRILWLYRWMGIPFSETTVGVFNKPMESLRNSRGMVLGLHLPNLGNCGYDFSRKEHEDRIRRVLGQIQKYKDWFSFHYAIFHPPEGNGTMDYEFYLCNLMKVGIPLILENIRGYDVKRFLSLYRNLKRQLGRQLSGICLDIPHAYLSGGDWRSYYKEFGGDVKVVHLSDCRKEMDLHQPFGMGGDLNLRAIVSWLDESGYRGILNFEIMPPSLGDLDRMFENYNETCQVIGRQNASRPNRIKIIVRTSKSIKLLTKLAF